MSIRRALVASVAVCFVSFTFASALYAQSLIGELAAAEAKRRAAFAATPEGKREAALEREQAAIAAAEARKARLVPTKVYDKDAPTVYADVSTPTAGAPAAAGVASTPTVQQKPKELEKGEAYWRGRVAPFHHRIAGTVSKSLFLRSRILDLTRELAGIGPLNARRGGVETERQRLITEAEAIGEVVRADKAAVEAIEEEGRVAGALPGWFR